MAAIYIEEEDWHEFPLAKAPGGAELLDAWRWLYVYPDKSIGNWDAQVAWARQAIEALAETLLEPGLTAWLSCFGDFLPDEVIGVAYALLNTDDGARFYMPEVKCMAGGPGFVQSFFNIEYHPGYIGKVFESEPGALVDGGSHVSLMFVPEPDSAGLARICFCNPDLRYENSVPDLVREALTSCRYLILPDHDFDMFRVASKKPWAERLVQALRKVLPGATWKTAHE